MPLLNQPVQPLTTPASIIESPHNIPVQRQYLNPLFLFGIILVALIVAGAILYILFMSRIYRPGDQVGAFVTDNLRANYIRPYSLELYAGDSNRMSALWQINKDTFWIDYQTQSGAGNSVRPHGIFINVFHKTDRLLDQNLAIELLSKYFRDTTDYSKLVSYRRLRDLPGYSLLITKNSAYMDSRMVTYSQYSTSSAILLVTCRAYFGTAHYTSERCIINLK